MNKKNPQALAVGTDTEPAPAALPDGFKMTELGPLPEEWQVVKLGEVFEIQQGKALSRKKDKGIRPRPFLRTANVFWSHVDLSVLSLIFLDEVVRL